jgi:hypothetical protein
MFASAVNGLGSIISNISAFLDFSSPILRPQNLNQSPFSPNSYSQNGVVHFSASGRSYTVK